MKLKASRVLLSPVYALTVKDAFVAVMQAMLVTEHVYYIAKLRAAETTFGERACDLVADASESPGFLKQTIRLAIRPAMWRPITRFPAPSITCALARTDAIKIAKRTRKPAWEAGAG